VYSHDIKWFDIRATTSDLFKKLTFHYGPTISHPGLRFAILACGDRERNRQKGPTIEELEYVGNALRLLTQNLIYPENVEEADLFAAATLALWSMKVGAREKFDKHASGVLSIMKHLSEKEKQGTFTSKFRAIWPLIRDQITTAAEYRHYGALRGLGNPFQAIEHLHRDFRFILGPKTIEQRQQFESQLRWPKAKGSPLRLVQQMMILGLQRLETSLEVFLNGFPQVPLYSADDTHNPYIESALVDSWADVQLFDDEPLAYEIKQVLTNLEVEVVEISETSGAYLLHSLQAILTRRLRLLMLLVLKETAAPQRGDSFRKMQKRNLLVPFVCQICGFIEASLQRHGSLNRFGKFSVCLD